MKVKYLILAALFMFAAAVNADNQDVLIAKIKQTNNAITSIHSKFSQKKTIKLAKKTIESEGELVYGKDYYLDMSYTKPHNNVTLIDGSKFVVKRGPATNRFNTDKHDDMRLLRNALINSFAGNVESIAAENGAEIEYEQKDGCHVFSIVNKTKKRLYVGFIVSYDAKTLLMKQVTILELNGNYTDYILSGTPEYNKPITEKKKL